MAFTGCQLSYSLQRESEKLYLGFKNGGVDVTNKM